MVSLHKYFSQMNQVLDWDILIAIIWITNSKFRKLGEGSMWLKAGNEAITWSSNISFLELINSKCKWNLSELSIFCWIYSTYFKYSAFTVMQRTWPFLFFWKFCKYICLIQNQKNSALNKKSVHSHAKFSLLKTLSQD